MKYFISLLFLLVANTGFALDLPNYLGRVNDLSNTLTASQLNDLEHKALNVKGAETGVLVIRTLDGDDIEGFSNKLFKKWGIGERESNNGVLLVIALNDRKLRIEVGYGLEGNIPDIVANHIIKDMKPFLKNKDLYGAINTYLDAVQGSIDAPAAAKTQASNSGTDWGTVLFWIIVLLVGGFVLFIFLAAISGGGGSGGGGSWGGGSDSSGGSSSSFGGGDSGGGGASGSW